MNVLSLMAAAAAERLPVSSRDDATATLANRIAAIADVVATIDGRLQRIEATTPPSPMLPKPIYPALVSVQDPAPALPVISGGVACGTTGATVATGSETIADDDIRADDGSGEGLVLQFDAVATVLAQANTRLSRIANVVGTSPGPATVEAAGVVWAQAASIFNRTARLLEDIDQVPPSAVCPPPHERTGPTEEER